jgi:hypothetical protein
MSFTLNGTLGVSGRIALVPIFERPGMFFRRASSYSCRRLRSSSA